MFRGIERRDIFVDDDDRLGLIARITRLIRDTEAALYAWALMPNHVHLLVRPGRGGISQLMHRLVGWYAASFNRRHRRHGHLMQNRFKSILVEEDGYLLELVRYLHLNPVRAGLVSSIDELDTYPWTGHARLMSTLVDPMQNVAFVLAQFGQTLGNARKAYRDFVLAGWAQGHRQDLHGSGLLRRRGLWQSADALRRGREAGAGDERILGSSDFVKQALADANSVAVSEKRFSSRVASGSVQALVECAGRTWQQCPAAIASTCKRRACAEARAVVCAVAVDRIGMSLADVADDLGVSNATVWRGVNKGRTLLARRPQIEHDLLDAIKDLDAVKGHPYDHFDSVRVSSVPLPPNSTT